jgi:hypothetical protein
LLFGLWLLLSFVCCLVWFVVLPGLVCVVGMLVVVWFCFVWFGLLLLFCFVVVFFCLVVFWPIFALFC